MARKQTVPNLNENTQAGMDVTNVSPTPLLTRTRTNVLIRQRLRNNRLRCSVRICLKMSTEGPISDYSSKIHQVKSIFQFLYRFLGHGFHSNGLSTLFHRNQRLSLQ